MRRREVLGATRAIPGGRRWRIAAWALGLAALAVVLVLGLSGRKGAATGRAAPALPHAALVGSPVTLAQLLGTTDTTSGGSPHSPHAALVLFWASWCTPCQHEAPAVERFARSAAGRGRIVGVDFEESENAAPRAFLRRYGWSFPNLSDPDAHAGEAYGVRGLPNTFVIDARGRVRASLRGPQTERSLARALAAVEG